jgi:hypothetical protein
MAATLLAKRRLRVRVLDTKFSLDPNLPVFGLETTPLLHPLLDEMGLVHDVRTRIYGPPKPITIALPDRRFSMSPDVRERAITFGEVFPKSIDELMKLFSMIEQYGPRMDGLLDGSIDLSADGFGIPSIRHGRKGLEELLAQKLLTTGGTIEDDRIAHRFDLRRKRVRTIETTDGAVFGADAIILSGGHYSLNKLTGDQTQSLPLAQLQTIAVPDQEIPSPFRDPCGWVETEGGHPVLARPGNGRIELMSAENHLPQLKTLLPMSRLARPNAEPLPWAGSDTVDLFGFCTAGIRSPLKNLLFVGEAVMPGLGIEGDCITAYQAADAVSSAKSSRWPFGSRL